MKTLSQKGVAIVLMKEVFEKHMRKLLLSLMKILSVTNVYLKMLNLLVIKTVLFLPPALQKRKDTANGKSKKKKKKIGK